MCTIFIVSKIGDANYKCHIAVGILIFNVHLYACSTVYLYAFNLCPSFYCVKGLDDADIHIDINQGLLSQVDIQYP